MVESQRTDDGFFPLGPASLCIEGPPQRQCYSAPKDFGLDPKAAVVSLKTGTPGVLFTASGGGVSGYGIHFALLRPGQRNDLESLLDITLSNQSQTDFWSLPEISDSKVFLTAEYVWGPDDAHYGAHRYIVSAYVLSGAFPSYNIDDQYMTVRSFDIDKSDDVLHSEKPVIVARLRRAKAEQDRIRAGAVQNRRTH